MAADRSKARAAIDDPLWAKILLVGTVLAVIRQWLDAPVVERGAGGGEIRSTVARDTNRGTPQGGVISPLLANL